MLILLSGCLLLYPPPWGEDSGAGDTSLDADGDGYAEECNDADPSVNPGATENLHDDIDQDCDGHAQRDDDGDGVASVASGGEDCDDGDPAVLPGASEVCDGIDQDCDGATDEDLGYADWYVDTDGDGYGTDAEVVSACAAPTGFAALDGDCDDTNPDANPGEVERCDEADNNCVDGADEDSAVDAIAWHVDADQDGFGAEAIHHYACNGSSLYVEDGTDCDDADPDAHPGGTEVCGDTIDQDCDGSDAGC